MVLLMIGLTGCRQVGQLTGIGTAARTGKAVVDLTQSVRNLSSDNNQQSVTVTAAALSDDRIDLKWGHTLQSFTPQDLLDIQALDSKAHWTPQTDSEATYDVPENGTLLFIYNSETTAVSFPGSSAAAPQCNNSGLCAVAFSGLKKDG